ncbi:MAG: hypothetical protein BWY31_01008 [Lentisphaerae bacterium ADurb.Bin242]|nr:MAG: hypothetical protein BWY31_01008 [Lentisphaerae bacterium ADurb.Bin242]
MKVNQRSLFLSGTVLLLAVFCPACADLLKLEPQDPADMTVQELIVKMNQATDPKGVYRNCKSYVMKQEFSTIRSGTRDNYSLEVKFKAPNRIRITTFRGSRATIADIYNNGQAWKVDCIMGKGTKVTGMGLSLVEIFSQMANPAMDATKIFKKVTIDMSTDTGVKMYRLICDPCKDGIAPYVFYIDGSTFLTVRLETIMYASDGEEYLYISLPTAYEWFGEFRIPTTSTVKLMDATNISKVTEFAINVDIPDSEFLPPVPFTHQAEILQEVRKASAMISAKPAEKSASASKKEKK